MKIRYLAVFLLAALLTTLTLRQRHDPGKILRPGEFDPLPVPPITEPPNANPAPAPGSEIPETSPALLDGATVLTFPMLAAATRGPSGTHIFPESILQLDGKTVAIKGFMAPYEDLDNLREFMLLSFSVGCFFCVPPSINQVLFIEQKGEQSRPFIDDPITVKGTFHLAQPPLKLQAHEDGFLFAILDAEVTKLPATSKPTPKNSDHSHF
jgi:hypothetical protein